MTEVEADSRVRHEYLAGEVIAMSGAAPRHARLAGQIYEVLEEYVIVAQDAVEVTAFRREEGWEPVVLGSLDSVLALRSIDLRVSLARVYEDEAV